MKGMEEANQEDTVKGLVRGDEYLLNSNKIRYNLLSCFYVPTTS